MASLLGGTITDLGHQSGSSEFSANSVINTLRLSPAGAHLNEGIPLGLVQDRLLEAVELLRALLHDLGLQRGRRHLDFLCLILKIPL